MEDVVMNRALAVALVVGGLVVGYAAGGSRLEAQSTASSGFPFHAGDSVQLVFALPETVGELCIIRSFSGSFVVCQSDGDVTTTYNLQTVFKAKMVSKGR
jgi:hypothetical protein